MWQTRLQAVILGTSTWLPAPAHGPSAPALDLEAGPYEERRHGVEVGDSDADVVEASYV
jgi:hypothetical protein